MTKYNQKKVGVLGYWSGYNYGSELTNYATYLHLKDLGYDVEMIDISLEGCGKRIKPPLFINNPYPENILHGRYRTKKELKKVNELCETFISSSDQQLHDWVYRITGKTAGLDFITSNKKKIAYAASYGNDFWNGDEALRAELAYFLKQIDHFSVREKSAVSLSKEIFGVDAQWVLDPVFLCDCSVYSRLAANAVKNLPKKPYIFSYVLDLNSENVAYINWCKSQKKLSSVVVTDAAKDHYEFQSHPGINIEHEVMLEDWLQYINNCDFYITDSFHGLCLGIILKKQFVCIVNDRGKTRIDSILGLLGLENRIAANIEEAKNIFSNNIPIDYNLIDRIIASEKEKSSQWLKTALDAPFDISDNCYSVFDICDKRCDYLEVRIDDIQDNPRNLRENLLLLWAAPKIKFKYFRYKVLSKILIGKKRKHYKHKAEIYHEKVRKIKILQNEALNV